jgi:hypothetical protein
LATRYEVGPLRSQGLVDVLDRILDKGLVVAGDIKINLANVELLTIQIRLIVCSIDKAEEIGMNWWRSDPRYAAPAVSPSELKRLNDKLDRMQAQLDTLQGPKSKNPKSTPRSES